MTALRFDSETTFPHEETPGRSHVSSSPTGGLARSDRSGSVLTALLLSALLAAPALAQTTPADAAAPAANASALDLAEGEVRRLDLEAGKVTLRHGEIRHLDMPPMTMVFQARDRALLAPLQVGDKVRFRAEKAAGGGYLLTVLQVAK
jgi:Cu/Ag efflux protein CusF